jgi:hypothetical protein
MGYMGQGKSSFLNMIHFIFKVRRNEELCRLSLQNVIGTKPKRIFLSRKGDAENNQKLYKVAIHPKQELERAKI